MKRMPGISQSGQPRARHRWSVVSRVAAAAVGGYVLVSQFAAALASILHQSGVSLRVDAVLFAMMAGLVVYAVAAMAVFHARSAARAWMWLGIVTAVCVAITAIFR